MCGKLDLYIGPMFSGKSTELIRQIRLFQKKHKVLVIKPLIDSRYNSDKITSHNYGSVECKVLNRLDEISDQDVNDYNTIVVDEGQFFEDLFQTVTRWVDNFPINIIVGGLNGDYQRNPIGQILELIPYSDHCYKLNSICNMCEDLVEAPFTLRLVNSSDKVLVGGSESYIPVCRKHFVELSKRSNH